MKDESIEAYMQRKIDLGLIAEDGHPLKCECNCEDFNRVDVMHGEGFVEEYSLECANEECLFIVGNWSYGYWQI